MSAGVVPALRVGTTPGPLFDGVPCVLAVATPDTPIRTEARRLARDALRALVAPELGCEPADVPLQDAPGSAPRLTGEAARIGVAIAHEAGLSLVAALRGGRIGVDLMRIEALPDWAALGADYLGPRTLAALEETAADQRSVAFAAAWTRLEAVLKCHGRQLCEWSPETAQLFPMTHFQPLALPQGYAGHVAWRRQ